MSTTITTHPITELEFPTVTVCPPRGSNTVLNHLLEKVKSVNFSEKEKQELLEMSREVFFEIPNRNYLKLVLKPMFEVLGQDNMKSIANGLASMPEPDKDGNIFFKSSEPEGSFKSPGFEDYLRWTKAIHFVLDLPDNIGNYVGEGALVVSVQSRDGRWRFGRQEGRFQLYKEYEEKMNITDAEAFCVHQGGHLASIGSEEEKNELLKETDYGRLELQCTLQWQGNRA